MKDKLITYALFILVVFALFTFSWPILSNVVTNHVEKVDSIDYNVSIP